MRWRKAHRQVLQSMPVSTSTSALISRVGYRREDIRGEISEYDARYTNTEQADTSMPRPIRGVAKVQPGIPLSQSSRSNIKEKTGINNCRSERTMCKRP
jgi:hypothetical protein